MFTQEQIDEMTTTDTSGGPDGWLQHYRENREDIRSEAAKAYEMHTEKAEEAHDLEQTESLRTELESRYPGMRASEVVKNFAQWDSNLRADPVRASEALAEGYARHARFAERKAPAESEETGYPGEVGVTLPDGTVIYRMKGTAGYDAALALAKRQRDAVDKQPLCAVREQLKEKFPDRKFSEVLRDVVQFDTEAAKNPLKAAARLAMSYGAPITAAQATRYEQVNQVAEQTTRLIETDPELQTLRGRDDEAAQLLASGMVQRTDNLHRDLRNAAALLRQWDRDRMILNHARDHMAGVRKRIVTKYTAPSQDVREQVESAWQKHAQSGGRS